MALRPVSVIRRLSAAANVVAPVNYNLDMKCLMKARREVGLDLARTKIPKIGPADVLIKVNSTSICGTDLHIYSWDTWAQATIPVPMVTGHEFAGVVVEVGEAARGNTQYHLKAGDRVTGEGHITCGFCRNCRAGQRHLCRNTLGLGVTRPGAFGEYVSLPAVNVFKLPDTISDRVASSMDPLGNAVHTALSFNLIGEDVIITGAGPIGCMAAGICKFVGARHVVITDVNDYRLDLAKKCGADITLNVREHGLEKMQQAMADLGMLEGFDVGLEMSGNQSAINAMIRTMNNGGKIALLGIPSDHVTINWNDVVFKGLVLKGIYGREMFETWYKMRNLLIAGLDKKLAPIWTHTFPVDDYEKGFKEMKAGTCGKVELRWT